MAGAAATIASRYPTMAELHFLRDVLIILAASVVMVFIFKRIRTSPILGYLVAGVLIGPYGLQFIGNTKGLAGLAELGIVFLLFSIGLELSFRRLATLRREVFGLGTAQVVLTGAIIGGIAWSLGLPLPAAIVIGAGLALSSTAIVLQLLAERGELSTRTGRTTFSILLLQDLAIVPLLAMIPLLDTGSPTTNWGDAGISVLKAIGAVAAILVIGRYLISPLFRAVAALKTHEAFIGLTLLAILGAGVATEEVGLSLTMGAFLAGLMMAETEFRHQIEIDIRPFQGLLMGLFFVTIGMSIDLGFAVEYWWQMLVLVAALIAIKATVITVLAITIARVPLSLAINTGLVLAQGGEFALVLVSVAADDAIIAGTASQVVVTVVTLSMFSTPFLAMAGRYLARKLEKSSAVGLAAIEQENIDLENHVIIAGFGRFGEVIGRLLDRNKIPYVAFDNSSQVVSEARDRGLPVYFGDAAQYELLWGLGIDRARAIVFTVREDTKKVTEVVNRIHDRLPDVSILARARDYQHARDLQRAGADSAIPDTFASSLHLAQNLMTQFGLPEEDLPGLMKEYGEAA